MRSCTQAWGSIELFRSVRVRQIEFASTIEADFICAVFDRKDTAEMTMPAAEDELDNAQQ
jgi:hypothetical protein